MSFTLPTKIANGVAVDTTQPIYFIEIDFPTPLRLSSRETLTIDGDVFTAANLQVDTLRGFKLFNENDNYSPIFLGNSTTGVGCKVWQSYGEGPFAVDDLKIMLDGELGSGKVGPFIDFNLKRFPSTKTPRIFIGPPTMNHLPPDGAEFATPTGVTVIRRA